MLEMQVFQRLGWQLQCACLCECVTYVCCGPQVNAVRVYVNSSSENLDYPVLVVVRQQKEVLSWQVPLLFQGL